MAADVSSTQNVELLNQGLWIFNKNGTPDTAHCSNETTTAPCESLYQFWCPSGASQPLPGCGSADLSLTDTQVAWDPIDKVWLATTLAFSQVNNTGTLNVAYTTSTSAADTPGNWLKWSTPLCNGNIPDEPVLGFGQNWAVIDTQCKNASAQYIADTITLVKNTDITGHTFNPTNPNTSNLPSDVFTWRPSRDVSASGFGYVYLVASVVTGSIAPYALISSIDPLGNVAKPTSLFGIGNSTDTYMLPLGAQGTCTNPSSGCGIDIGDAHIRQAPVLQYDPGNNDHYLLAAFAAGNGSSGAESLYYFLQVDNNAVAAEIVGSTSYVLAYPTIVADQDQDFYLTTTSFAGGGPIYSSWYASHGFLTIEAQGYLQTSASNSTYTGDQSCGGTGNPRWGDYMSTVWDPSQTSVGGEKDAFWSVQEFTAGGADQSTEWLQLNDPLPYFVGCNVPSPPAGQGPAGGGENECPNGTGYYCNLTYSAPSNAQFGDAFVVVQWIGDAQDSTYLTVPTGWTKLPYEGGSHTLYSTDGKLTDSYYVALYVYGSQPNDTGQYEFKILPQVSGAETLGFLVAYRGASPNIPGNYKLYGKAATQDSTNIKTVTLSPQNNDSPAAESTLLSLFSQGCVGSDDPDLFVPFGSPSGTPTLTVETPLRSTKGFFAADVGVPTGGGTYGLYKSTISCESLNTGISLVIPE